MVGIHARWLLLGVMAACSDKSGDGRGEGAERTEAAAMVARVAVTTLAALEAAGVLDAANARAELGRQWDGSVPEVGNAGVIRLRGARHPVLALRAKETTVVPNDLALDDRTRALVLTGPNAGGKTVALKTVGLCAVLARMAVPLPAGEGSRLDVFDLQSDRDGRPAV